MPRRYPQLATTHSSVTIGNGAGLSSEIPGFGLAGGGGYSWRYAAYVADSWKASANLTLTAGIRYSFRHRARTTTSPRPPARTSAPR